MLVTISLFKLGIIFVIGLGFLFLSLGVGTTLMGPKSKKSSKSKKSKKSKSKKSKSKKSKKKK